jgi:hypothetical protein
MRLLKKYATLTSIVLFGLVAPARAALITAQFCPGDSTCPAGVTATLTITENASADDINDYDFNVTFVGTAAAPAYLDLFSFTVAGAATPAGYEALPTLNTFTSTPAQSVAWSTFFDQVDGAVTACTSNTNQANEVCTNSTTPAIGAALASHTLSFDFYVDLNGDFQIAPDNGLNLRAAFHTLDGGNAGILSPDGNYTGGGGSGGGGATIPEPASMLLFGFGALASARRLRRRHGR